MKEYQALGIKPGSEEWDRLDPRNKREIMRFIPIYLSQHPDYEYPKEWLEIFKEYEVQISLGIIDEDFYPIPTAEEIEMEAKKHATYLNGSMNTIAKAYSTQYLKGLYDKSDVWRKQR